YVSPACHCLSITYPLSMAPFFSFLFPPPPSSPLFPYTTLFRSGVAVPAARRAGRRPDGRLLSRAAQGAPAAGEAQSVAETRDSRDRKSTRLNSSHGSISYAVFCLKKKKKKQGRKKKKLTRRAHN